MKTEKEQSGRKSGDRVVFISGREEFLDSNGKNTAACDRIAG